jgi:hypothetical protein
VTTLLWSRTVAWHEIADFGVRQPRLFRILKVDDAECLWIVLRDGTAIEAPVLREQPPKPHTLEQVMKDLMPRRETRKQVGQMVLGAQAFDRMVASLRQRLTETRG